MDQIASRTVTGEGEEVIVGGKLSLMTGAEMIEEQARPAHPPARDGAVSPARGAAPG